MKTNAIANIRRRNFALVALTLATLIVVVGAAKDAKAGGFTFTLNTGHTSIGIGIGDTSPDVYVAPTPLGAVRSEPLPHPRTMPAPPPRERFARDARPDRTPPPIVRGAEPYRGQNQNPQPRVQDARRTRPNDNAPYRQPAPVGGPMRAPRR